MIRDRDATAMPNDPMMTPLQPAPRHAPGSAPHHALKLLIVDDEPLARARLRMLLQELAVDDMVLEVVAEAIDGPSALHRLKETAVDVILLDVHMPGLDGVALSRDLRQRADPPVVIFVSAHAEHALEAFEVEAADYLHKPVTRSRLQEALERARRRLRTPAAPAVLTVSHRGGLRRIPVQEILYLKSEWKYVTLRTASEQHVLDDSLLDLEQRLGPGFLRVHRNALVAVSAVEALERRTGGDAEAWSVRIKPVGEWIDVSRRQLPAVRGVLEGDVMGDPPAALDRDGTRQEIPGKP